MIAFLLSSSFAIAQLNVKKLDGANVQKSTLESVSVKAKTSLPKHSLAANQRYVGTYNSDALSEYGSGIPQYATGTCRAAIEAGPEVLAPYVGMKVVGIRFGLCSAIGNSRVFMAPLTQNSIGNDVVSQDVSTTEIGWNTVMLDNPYTIPSNPDFLVGYDYTQLNKKSNGSYTAACYPLSCVNEGLAGQYLYIYANISSSVGGSGTNWYSFNSNGNLSVQLIVEGAFKDYNVVPVSIGNIQTAVGKEKAYDVQLINAGTTALDNISYTITQDGVTSAEKVVTFDAPITETYPVVSIPFFGATKTGEYPVTLTITKVNGVTNNADYNSAEGTNTVKAKDLKPVVVMEEFTGTGCGWCPRGIVGMKKATEKFGDQFIGIGIHQYSSADPMYNANYASLGFSGAPSCMLNRATSTIDPYYGSGEDICDDISDKLAGIADAGVSVAGSWIDGGSAIEAKATIEAQAASTYQIAYVVTGDNVYNSSWSQSNYYSKAYSSQTGITEASLPDDLKFLYNENKYCPQFNDVLLSSSYNRTTNKAGNVEVPADGSVENVYKVDMSSLFLTDKGKVVYSSLDKDKLSIVALLINPSTKAIVAAAKSPLSTWTTGINGIVDNNETAVTARYSLDGMQLSAPQKGLNIVKLSDGRTVKVMVK